MPACRCCWEPAVRAAAHGRCSAVQGSCCGRVCWVCLHPACSLQAPAVPFLCVCGGAFLVSCNFWMGERSPFLEMTPVEVVWGCRICILGCRGDVLIHAAQGEPTLHLKTGQGGKARIFFPLSFCLWWCASYMDSSNNSLMENLV